MKSPREWILPVALSLASILLTSLVLAEVHSHLAAFHVWSDPEDLALVYLLPTIFIAVFFGSTIAATSSFASGLAAAYFIYPPKGVLIADPQHVAELGFIILLAITASKAVAVITDDKPLTRRLGGDRASHHLKRRTFTALPYRTGRSRHWIKSKNPQHPAVKREVEEDWGREHWR